jgi:KDO2-lipid IV(A) lauroyltransferase
MEARRVNFHAEGADHLQEALSAPRGLILLTAHVGPFEAAARYFSQVHQLNLMVVMNKEVDERARQFHDELRKKVGVVVAHIGEHALDALPVLQHLQAGGVAAIQLDRLAPSARGVSAQFFGGSWAVPEGPLRLAALAEVPIMTVFARRRGYFDYELVMSELLMLTRRPSASELAEVAQKLASDVERAILRDPTQWFHFA